MWMILRRILFWLDPEWAHALGSIYLKVRGFIFQGACKPVRWLGKSIPELGGVPLDSPLGVAAGFDKDGTMILGLRSLGFGFIEVGSVTPLPQSGNPRPRIFRVPESRAMINRMGFNSQGAKVVGERLRSLRAMVPIKFPIGINLGKNRDTPLERAGDDYVRALGELYDVADYLVINVSSPNTPGLTDLQEEDFLKPLLEQVREERDRLARKMPGFSKPLFLKLSPDLTAQARKIAVETAASLDYGIIASNTSRRRDFPGLNLKDPILKEAGGISGAPLRQDALAHIKEIRAIIGSKPLLISVGGLGSAQDARERLAAGANFIQVYTEFVYSGPSYPRQITKGLSRP